MIDTINTFKSIIADYEILIWEIEPEAYRFKAILHFTNGSNLFVRDYLFPDKRKYSFHWQDENEHMIARWDNAKHWQDIQTYPFHKHEADEVHPSTETSLHDVLSVYCKKLRNSIMTKPTPVMRGDVI